MVEPIAPLQQHIQVIFYRMNYGQFEYLTVLRIDKEKDFWQLVTERVSKGRSIADTVRQAAIEQVGIRHFKRLSEATYSYEWYTHGQRGRDIVFAAEVEHDAAVTLDTGRYSQYTWMSFDEAMKHIKWSGAKDALRELHVSLEAERLHNPEYWQTPETGIYSPASTVSSSQSANDQAGNPYGPNVPKRLPDRPNDGHERKDDDREVNTGELFL